MASNDPAPAQTLDSKPAPTGGVAVASAEPAGPAERKPTHESVGSVIAAITANILVGIVKFIAAAISGSVAMVSEGIHSIVDSGNGFLVLLGIHKAKKPPTIEHPFGLARSSTSGPSWWPSQSLRWAAVCRSCRASRPSNTPWPAPPSTATRS